MFLEYFKVLSIPLDNAIIQAVIFLLNMLYFNVTIIALNYLVQFSKDHQRLKITGLVLVFF